VLGGLINVDANSVPFIVDVHNNAFFDFSGIKSRAVRQFDVKTVRFWKIFDFYGLYLPFGKAFYIFVFSLSVTARK
jgi:hypothetical protein